MTLLGWVYNNDVLCIKCHKGIPPPVGYKALTEENVANREDTCMLCKRVYRDGQWLERINKKDKAKNGDEVWINIDPDSDPYCTVSLWSLGVVIGLSVETPEQATALYEALLNVQEVEID